MFCSSVFDFRERDTALQAGQAVAVAVAWRLGRGGDTVLPKRRGRCFVARLCGFREGDTVLLEGAVLGPGSGLPRRGHCTSGDPSPDGRRGLAAWARWGHCSSGGPSRGGRRGLAAWPRWGHCSSEEKGTVFCSAALRVPGRGHCSFGGCCFQARFGASEKGTLHFRRSKP